MVSRAGDLRPGDLREAESVEGDVWSEDGEEQDNQLRAGVSWGGPGPGPPWTPGFNE